MIRYYFKKLIVSSLLIFTAAMSVLSASTTVHAAGTPTITSLSPASGYTTGGDSVTITGTNFDNGAIVKFGQNAAQSVSFINASTLLASSPAGYQGPVDVSVKNLDGQTAVSVNGFMYTEPGPTIVSVNPSAGPVRGGQSILVNGSNFSNGLRSVTSLIADTTTPGGSGCGIYNGYKVYCWGYGASGQLGNGSSSTVTTPTPITDTGVLAGKTVRSITNGAGHRCSIASDEKVYCWGSNGQGQLGNNTTTQSNVPIATDATGALAGKSVRQIVAGDAFTCALTSEGKVYCWGLNNFGQLGNNSTTRSLVPVAIDMSNAALTGKSIQYISAGAINACLITTEGKAFCWGANSSGQIGNNATATSVLVPTPVTMDTGVLAGLTLSSIATGNGHTCAIASDTYMYCWGSNSSGQVGNNSSTNSKIPVALAAPLTSTAISNMSTGPDHTCAVTTNGIPYCWGANSQFQLGNNTATLSKVPFAVDTSGFLAGKTVRSITTGYQRSCAIASDAQAYCWGWNSSSGLGDGTGTSRRVPNPVSRVNQANPIVMIGGTTATFNALVSSTQLRVTTPAHAAGPAAASVQQYDSQTATQSNAYEFVNGPQVSSVSPNIGPLAGGTSITIKGSNFYTGMTVAVDGVAASNVQVVDVSTITATTPANTTPGAKSVAVADPYAQTSTLASAFTYTIPNPTITSVNPIAASYSAGTTITIKGSNFVDWGTGATFYKVSFGGASGTQVTYVDSATLTVTLPNRTPGVVDVSITSDYAATTTLTKGFTFLADHYGFKNAPLTIAANQTGKLTIQPLDSQNQPVAGLTDTRIDLTSSSTSGQFATDLNESDITRWTHTYVTLPAGATSVDVWYRDATSGTPTVIGSVLNGTKTFQQQQKITSKYRFIVSGVSDPIAAGVPSSVTVRVVDYAGNPLRDYVGSFVFSSTDTTASLPTNYSMTTADKGIKTFTNGVIMKTSGEFCVSATDTIDNTITGSQCAISVQSANSGAIDHLAVTTQSQSIPVDTTSAPVTIQAQDTSNNGIPVSVDTPLYITADSATTSFSTDGITWSTAQPYSPSISAGSSSLNVYVKDSASKTVTLDIRDLSTDSGPAGGANDTGWKNTSQQIIVGVGAASTLSLQGLDTLVSGQKGSYTIQLKDANGTVVTALRDYELQVSANTGSALFYINGSNTGVSSPQTLPIPTGASSIIIQVSDTTPSVANAYTIITATDTADSKGQGYAQQATQDIQIISAQPGSATLAPDTSTVESGVVTAMTLSLLDTNGAQTYASAPTAFQLRTSSGSGQYSLTQSPFTPVTSITLQRGEGMKRVYYRDTLAGTSSLRAVSGSLGSPSSTITITSSSLYRYGVTSTNTAAELNTVSNAFTITGYDVYGNAVIQNADSVVYLYSSEPAVQFASQTNGPFNETSVTIPNGQSSTQFYAKGTDFIAQPATLTIADESQPGQSDTGVVNATTLFAVTNQHVDAVEYTSSPHTITAGSVTQQIIVQLKKSDGSPAIQDGSTSLSFSVSEGKIVATQDANAAAITSVTIAKNASSATFYYTAQKSGTYSIRAAMGTTFGTQIVTVTPAQPYQLLFTSSPQSIPAGQPSAVINARLADQYGNTTSYDHSTQVQLSSSCGDGTFSQTDAPWQATADIPLDAGTDSVHFHYKGSSTGSCTLSVKAEGIVVATQSITITATNTGPYQLLVAGPAQVIKGGTDGYTVSIADASGNVVAATSPIDVRMTSSDSNDTITPNTLHFNVGDTTHTFNFGGQTVHTATLTAHESTASLVDGSTTVLVINGAPTQMQLTPPTATLRAGERVAMTIDLLNTNGSIVPAQSDTAISLSSNASSGSFYSSTTSQSAITRTSITSGTSSVTVYYTQTTGSSSIVYAAATALPTVSAVITLLPANVATVSFTNQPYTNSNALESGQTGTFNISLLDQYGNSAVAPSDITLYATSGGDGSFNNNGVFTIPAGQSRGSINYTQNQTGSFTVSVSDSDGQSIANLGPTTQQGVVVFGAVKAVHFVQSSLPLERGAVSERLEITLLNSSGRIVPAPVGGQTVRLSMAVGTGTYATDPNGSFASTLQITVPEGETQAGFYYRNDDAAIEDRNCSVQNGTRTCVTTRTYQHLLYAQTTAGGTQATDSLAATMSYGAPVRYVITTPPRQQYTDRATQLITVERQNQYGKPVPLHRNSLLAIKSSANETGSFGTSKVTWDVTQAAILDSDASTSFYYKDSAIGQPVVSIAAADQADAEIAGDSQTMTIVQATGPPPPAAALVVTNISDPQTQGTPSSVIVIAVDADGFIVDSYSGKIHFTSNDASSILPADYTFDPSTDKGSKTFTNQVAFSSTGEKAVTVVDAAGLTGSQTDITVLGGNTNPVRSIRISSPPAPLLLGKDQSSGQILIELADASGAKTVAPAGGIPIRLTSSSIGGQFRLNFINTPWQSTQVVIIPEGISYTVVYYKDSQIGTHTIRASDWINGVDQSNIVNTSLAVTVSSETTVPTPDPSIPVESGTNVNVDATQSTSGRNTTNETTNTASQSDTNQPEISDPDLTPTPPKVGSEETKDAAAGVAKNTRSLIANIVTVTIGSAFVFLLLAASARHVIVMHRLQRIVTAHHIASAVIQKSPLLQRVMQNVYSSVYFLLPVVLSVVTSGLVTWAIARSMQDTPVPNRILIEIAVLMAISVLIFTVSHSRYLAKTSQSLKKNLP